jgi:hypothetical protein
LAKISAVCARARGGTREDEIGYQAALVQPLRHLLRFTVSLASQGRSKSRTLASWSAVAWRISVSRLRLSGFSAYLDAAVHLAHLEDAQRL